ncbi:MAG: hypothetical protein V1821_03525, partial [bacterium]
FGKNACKGAEELIIVANLPYLPTSIWEKSMPDVHNFEPREALDGGADGLDLYRVLFNQLEDCSKPALVFCEIDPSQSQTLPAEIKKRFPLAETRLHKDLSGRNRVVAVRIA